MTFRTSLLRAADAIRAIAGPSGFDVVTSQVTIRTTTWSGGRRGLGTASNSDLALPQYYNVRHLTQEEIAQSGGRYEAGAIRFGPITPSNGAGVGYTIAQLKPTVTSDGIEVIYVVTGGITGNYTRAHLERDRAFRYVLILDRRRDTP